MNIGQQFFDLINCHFLTHRKISKIFHKNTIMLNYSCCRNIGSVKTSHNRRVFQPTSNNHGGNFRNRAECQHENKCLTVNIAYKAVVSTFSKSGKKYFGISETTFKERFRNHTRDFRHEYVNNTELLTTSGN